MYRKTVRTIWDGCVMLQSEVRSLAWFTLSVVEVPIDTMRFVRGVVWERNRWLQTKCHLTLLILDSVGREFITSMHTMILLQRTNIIFVRNFNHLIVRCYRTVCRVPWYGQLDSDVFANYHHHHNHYHFDCHERIHHLIKHDMRFKRIKRIEAMLIFRSSLRWCMTDNKLSWWWWC